ncbi:TSUP family transporter [Agriterribacter sp.]|uniref:TSUP family transporter n=1 Tax=Agriterribacter sp. TaxID=2821509 RepID=UPI002B6B03AA|nr:TSUP family transporter [Agriterribacter sp.]HRO45598.1 TSUP family transporter [Agriterribacter sp.]HRQ18677.1 TSUP family transporter [Agriterribacter sp.]
MAETTTIQETNQLFPVFLKLEQLKLLIVGAGNVGLEKLHAVLQNSPATAVTIVAPEIKAEVKILAEKHTNITIVEGAYDKAALNDADLVIVAVNNSILGEQIRSDAHERGLLVNVADTPDLCDFYLGSIVKKGNLKVAISTNGKSPTIAKRLKEAFNEILPEELDDVLHNMEAIRKKMNGNFARKVHELNHITKVLSVKDLPEPKSNSEKRWRRIVTWCLFAFFFMFAGHLVLSYLPLASLVDSAKEGILQLDSKFYWMIAAGFLAQMVDGMLGMGYGVVSTTILMSLGINIAAISGSIHTAEMFSSGASGYTHYKFGNVNKKLFKALLIPGIVGAVLGAYLLSKFGEEYAGYIRPLIACYTMLLGVRILIISFRKKTKKPKKVKRVGWLAGAGGFLDSFGGGGWGPLVTSTLISKGRSPRFVIGSVSITEFFVTFASALTFFTMIGVSHWQIIVGLIIGGVVAAPLAARLVGKLPTKTMFIAVGTMVIIWSLRILLKSAGIL